MKQTKMETINIVMINGQNHKGISYHLGKIFCDEIGKNVKNLDVKEFFLPKDLNGFCLGCYNCIDDETKCYRHQEKEIILEAMEKADILLFTTPNYCMSVSAQMKAFLDYYYDLWMTHRPKEWMFKKKAVVFSTSAGAYPSGGLKLMETNLNGWGISYVKGYGKPVQAKNWQEVSDNKKEDLEEEISKLARKVLNKKVKTTLKIKIMFKFFRFLHIKGWDSSVEEKKYWDEKGWLGKKRPWKE